jgi:uncharacterized protein (DUF1015 family)
MLAPMSRVTPFAAVRPAPLDPGRLSPPYDVIRPDERARLAQDPHNPVHLILPQDDAGEGSRYAAAARTLAAWLHEGALRRDAAPAFYVHEQAFAWAGRRLVRRGVFGLLELSRFGEQGLFAHEFTLTAPREDRFRLLGATHANLSPAFVLYEDHPGEVWAALEHARARPPLGRVTTDDGAETLWALPAVSDGTKEGDALAEGARTVAEALTRQGLVVADGHHRYESALRYREERRASADAAPFPQAYDFMMACFVDVADPGLLVLPTHRVVRGLAPFTLDQLLARLAPAYRCERLGASHDPAAIEERAQAFLAAHPAGAFVAVVAGESGPAGFALDAAQQAGAFAGTGIAPLLTGVDVVQLSTLVLEKALGITAEKLAAQSHVEYVKSAADAIRVVLGVDARGGEVVGAAGALPVNAAFLLNGTPVRQVLEVARAGSRLPQKSTYFLPKITTGWLYHVHDAPRAVWGDTAWAHAAPGLAAPPPGPALDAPRRVG